MTKPNPSFSPRRISTSYGCTAEEAPAAVFVVPFGGWEDVVAVAVATTVFPLAPAPTPPPPPLPMPEVEPLPELTVLREFWLPCGVRFPISSVRLGAWVLLWCEDAGDGGTSPSDLTRRDRSIRIWAFHIIPQFISCTAAQGRRLRGQTGNRRCTNVWAAITGPKLSILSIMFIGLFYFAC
ncbi:hypothetical protein XENOCAPTIV_010880 [Xenoophorus captivus]|uniref:Uncharacterized protein n=1 Tax=Xenoophorus captivus TaxID=1517983 RepID=A0ABV0SGY5_9TELE